MADLEAPLFIVAGLYGSASTWAYNAVRLLLSNESPVVAGYVTDRTGDPQLPFVIAIGVFFPVYANFVSGIRQIDRKLIEAARAYGYDGLALAGGVLLPAALPSLLTGLRIGLAQGWLFLVAAELIAASRGLGFLLIDGQNSGRADIIVLSIIILAIIGKLTDTLLAAVERRLLRWADTYRR